MKKYLAQLLARLQDPNPSVRQEAAGALGRGRRNPGGKFQKLLDSPPPSPTPPPQDPPLKETFPIVCILGKISDFDPRTPQGSGTRPPLRP